MIVWITGASTGIGRSLALKYCTGGATVIATARSAEKLRDLQVEARGLPGTIHIRPADVTVPGDIRDACNWLVTDLGVPDKAILNAGTYFPTPAKTLCADEHTTIMDVNYGGVVICLDAILPHLLESGAGQIAVVASVAGYRGLPRASAYSASKAALIALAESLREELRHGGVDIRLINPGFVKTPLTDQNKFPMPFLMDVEDAAQKIVHGLETGRFEIAFPLPFVIIMKFLKLLPDWIYFRIAGRMSR